MPDHPTKDELSGFMLGTLPAEASDVVAEHVGHCPPCQETVHQLDGHRDTLLELLRAKPPAPIDAEAYQVVEKVAAIAKGQTPVQTDPASAPSVAAQPSVAGRAIGPVPSRLQFVAALRSSGVLDADRWPELEKRPAVVQAADGNALARALVECGALTKFQATLIYQNKSKGLLFGEYVVLDRIGAGGMGQVFKARHRSMDRVVALKVLAKSAVGSPEAVKRFQREAKAAAKLLHTNIVTAFDAGQQDGVHFLVMEYVDGSDLAEIVKSQGPLSVDKAVDYILQAARGLEFAHKKGVIHRDIKPANLLLGSEGTVKILDMGLARIDDAMGGGAGVQDGLTQSGQVMGTVDYMAPEQAVDTREADARADVYALGCTLHRLLTGENVFGGETLVQKLLAHRENPIPSLTVKRADVPAELDAVFRKMVAKRPEDRMQSMREVIEALEQLVRALKSLEAGIQQQEPSAFVVAERNPVGRTGNSGVNPQIKGVGRKQPPTRMLIAAGAAAAAFLICLGVWLIIRDNSGNLVARIEATDGTKVQIPPGGSVEVATSPQPAVAAAPAATRWPLTPSKPDDIVWLQGLQATLMLRSGPTVETVLEPTAAPPAEPTTIVGIEFSRNAGAALTDDALKRIATLVDLESLRCVFAELDSPATKYGLPHLASLVNLRRLELGRIGAKDTNPAFLASFPKLEYLALQYTSYPGWEPVVGRLPSLTALKVFGVDTTNLEQLGPHPRLTSLTLAGYGTGRAARDASAKRFAAIAPWCRIEVLDTKKGVNAVVIEPTDPPPGAASASVNPQPVRLNPQSPPPAIDAALQFDGDDVVEIPSLTFEPQGSYTLEGYVTSPAKADQGDGLVFGMPDQSYLSFTKVSNWRWVYVPQLRNAGTEMSIAGAPTREARTHLACVRDGQAHRLYVDGQLFFKTAEIQAPTVGTSLFQIGPEFRGIVDELRVSKVARYKANFPPPTRFETDADTLGLYHFDEAQGNVLTDSSGANRHGKITGAVWVKADGAKIESPPAP